MAKTYSGKQVMSGTFGEVWIDNEYVSEIYKAQAKDVYNKSPIAMCGKMGKDYKVTSIDRKGSLGLNKVNSRMLELLGDKIRNGQDFRVSIILKLDDPDADGPERVKIMGVSFDELILADWEAGVAGKMEIPFTYSDWIPLDKVKVGE